MDAKRQNIYGGYTNPNPTYNQYYYQYLTVEILEDGYFYMSGVNYQGGTEEVLYYNKNNGGWASMPSSESNPIAVSKNDIIRFKSKLDTSKDIEWGFYVLADDNVNASFNVYGNIMSLVHGDDFINNSELPVNITVSPFSWMFEGVKVCDASNLCLPTVYLLEEMYMGFFRRSTIEYAPKIIPAHLANSCYQEMFDECEYLKGQIIIPTPLNFPITCEDAYTDMFSELGDKVDDPVELVILVLLNKQVGLEDLAGMCPNSNLKTKIVLPWEGVDSVSNTINNFKAELKYFESENHGYIDNGKWATKFVKSNDIFGHVLNTPQKPETVPTELSDQYISWIYDLSRILQRSASSYPGIEALYNIYTVIDPLQYFLNTPLTFETIDVCEFKWMNGYVPGNSSGKDVITDPEYIREYTPINFLEYSINNGPWRSYKDGVLVPANSTISWRSSTDITSSSTKCSFRLLTNGPRLIGSDLLTCRFNAYGNIMSLLSPNFETLDTIPWDNCFGGYRYAVDNYSISTPGCSMGMFYNTQIQSAENLILPAINLTDGCYTGLFADSNLVISPRILPTRNPRNVTGCYTDMFSNCSNLQTCPILMLATFADPPANGVTSIPDASVNNTCRNMCAGMFYNCSSLSVAPEIHICYVNIHYPYEDYYVFAYMFYNTAIKQLKIFTHSSTPGYSNGNAHGIIFGDMLDDMNDVTVYCYDKFPDGSSDLYLSTIKSLIGGNYLTIENLHSSEVPEETPEDNKSIFYIQHNGKAYEFEKTREDMTWAQFLFGGAEHTIQLGSNKYYLWKTGTATGIGGKYSICLYDAFDTSSQLGYGSVGDYAGKLCNSTNERDNVLSSNYIQTNKTYYINRYVRDCWW